MRRRDFITTMAVGTAAWPLSIRADQPAQVPLIGVLSADKADSPFAKLFMSAFPKLLQAERGSAFGAKTEIQYRFSGGDTDPTRASARELIGMRPAVIVQRGLRTPTGPFFARFFIDIILGLVAEFAFMGPSTRLAMSPSAARWMDRKQIVGWRFQHGCSTGRHA